ncbi:TrkH family potassium uptake protein [Gottfriedia luciferensis]|uniref:TrkH family potassium uptake protein n=1 Tax=Gottfriedia luciferensis TaxID=178774 RepID=UPI000B42F6C2|nr:potassium transporter TrkG [Gottfriedia luciferensis]
MKKKKKAKNPLHYIFISYIIITLLFSFLYYLPFTRIAELSYIDSLFVSTSAISVTGLTTVNLVETFNVWGKILLMIQMEIGAIGIVVFISYVFMVLGIRITISNLLVLSKDQNQSSIKSIRRLSLSVLFTSLFFQLIGGTIFYSQFRDKYDSTSETILVTAFHSIASFTNTGFDLFGNSLLSFQKNNVVLIVTAALIFIGGLGYPTIMEYIYHYNKKKSLFTRINMRLHFSFMIIGTIIFWLLESNHAFKHLNFFDKMTNSFFLSVTTRNGGFAPLNIAELTLPAILIILMLMFIGGASSSAAGGIRLTTVSVLIAKMISVIKSQDDTIIFRTSVKRQVVDRAFVIAMSFILLISFATIIITIIEPFQLDLILLEVISAITNTGLSLGITTEIHSSTKFILILLMFIGRIGIFTMIYFVFRVKNQNLKYIEKDLAVG